MRLSRLQFEDFRNFESLDITLNPYFNFIQGLNGSGKTSLLEGIYFLGMGRSFRTHLLNRLIRYEQPYFRLVGWTTGSDIIGIEKSTQKKLCIKLNGEPVRSASELVELLPIQLIGPDSYHLIDSGPKYRRAFLDWGMFHVEHRFFPLWQRFQRALQQRNAALQSRAPRAQVEAWNADLAVLADLLTEYRRSYFSELLIQLNEILKDWVDFPEVSACYYRGWPEGKNLLELWRQNFLQDSNLGYTQQGPHRADIQLNIQGIPVQDRLSRGEKKVFVCALHLAQGLILTQKTQKNCLYLIDDLASELDSTRRTHMTYLLKELKAQVLITGLESFTIPEGSSAAMFHVKQGCLFEQSF